MNKQILTLAFSTVFGIGIAAAAPVPQDQQAPPAQGRRVPQSPEQQAAQLGKRLNLSDDQVNQIKPILADQSTKMQALRQDQSSSREDRMAKMKSIREDTDTKIKALLTDDQKAQYDKWQEEQRARMMERRQSGGAPQQ
jgi:periplasmic protein CpxP/Spy